MKTSRLYLQGEIQGQGWKASLFEKKVKGEHP
jgi:hypothetical protein